ncbi:leucine-rich repeat-containing protein 42 [Rhinatrema bivittatum]|uniref:leucine-rich repeat-containing protein 42 n=1 Tax=Rhinatrema bivittatum TaxID=194408 RepID=UPI001125BF67|nr:leucine-rich repeat-containing protein 42 [Rhinatrema bivittatum]
MSYYISSESPFDAGPIYVRESGQLHLVNKESDRAKNTAQKPRPCRLFAKGFSVALCMNGGDDASSTQKKDHFIFTYTREGSLRYSAKSLFNLVLGFISDNVCYLDSLMGFPEQIAEALFTAAEARRKFTEPGTGLEALQKFTAAYGSLVLSSLCLRNRYLVVPEKLEEIKSFRELTCLDLSCCKLGDAHELLEHVTTEALSSLVQLYMKDNCLSDVGLRRMTAPVRVMKRGLQHLAVLDLSCNPKITDAGITFLFCFRKLNSLDISDTGVKDNKAAMLKIRTQLGLFHSKEPLKEFDHTSCKTEGWAEQVVVQWWENGTSQSTEPKETAKVRTEAQCFYGKRKRSTTERQNQCTVVDTEPKAPGKLQFYRTAAQSSCLPMLHKDVFASPNHKMQTNKVSGVNKQDKEAVTSAESAKQKAACLAAEDWDLLNTYSLPM